MYKKFFFFQRNNLRKKIIIKKEERCRRRTDRGNELYFAKELINLMGSFNFD